MEAFTAGEKFPETIALCLSGGGLRATFFHLGVITALREAGLLPRVKEVFSVSGGSIAAGHLAMHWQRYTGSDQDFAAVAKELRAIGGWDIRNRVIRRWVLGGWIVGLGRTELLQKQYERLFGRETLQSCALRHSGAPEFYVLATSFNTGDLCSFSKDTFAIHSETPAKDGYSYETTPVFYPADNIRLSFAVAASSAFPPLFPPLRLTWDLIGGSSEGAFNAIALTDGGVFDNLGFEKFASLDEKRSPGIEAVIISDAGGTFNSAIRDEFYGILKRNIRATDILMRRNAKATVASIKAMRERRRVARISIARTATLSGHLVTTQTRLQNIRTDLDRFSAEEVEMLVAHGRDVMRAEMKVEPPASETIGKYLGLARSASEEEAAEKSARRGSLTRLGLFNWKDSATYALIAVVGIILTALYYSSMYIYKEVSERVYNYHYTKFKDIELKIAAVTPVKPEDTGIIDLTGPLRPGGSSGVPSSIPGRTPTLSPDLPGRPVNKADYKVWIQFAGRLTREEMKTFGNQLLVKSWKALGAEQGGERTPNAANLNEIRYNPETDRRAAQQLADDVNASGIVPTRVQLRPLSIIPKNSLEIWISK